MTNFKLSYNRPGLFTEGFFHPVVTCYCILVIKPGWTVLIVFVNNDHQILLANFSLKWYNHKNCFKSRFKFSRTS